MTSPPVLALLDYTQDFIIETDAANMGIRVVLIQGGHSLAFISKVLSLKHQGLSIYEKELFMQSQNGTIIYMVDILLFELTTTV